MKSILVVSLQKKLRKKFGKKNFLILITFALLPLPLAQAKLSSLSESHRGLKVSTSYLTTQSAEMDPLSEMLEDAASVQKNPRARLMPLSVGLFFDREDLSIEARIAALTSSSYTWDLLGNPLGSGRSKYSSYGAGIQINLPVKSSSRFRLYLLGAVDFFRHQLQFKFSPSSQDPAQRLKLTGNSITLSGGIEPEFWLGDFWILFFRAGYMESPSFPWKVTQTDSLFHQSWSKGTLSKNSNGEVIRGRMKDVFFSLGLKLAFY